MTTYRFQFWFIRDLIVLVFFSPLVYFALKLAPRITLIVMAVCWLADVWPAEVPQIEAALFFSLGAVAGIRV